MKKTTRRVGPQRPRGFQDQTTRRERSTLGEYGPMAFGGLMLVLAFAFAGHYMGQNAVAHNAEPGDKLAPLVSPSSNIIAKGSLMPDGTSLDIVNMTSRTGQIVDGSGKGDMPIDPPVPETTKADAER